MNLRVGSSFRLVAEHDVGEGEDRGHLVLEELTQERGGEIQAVGLVVLGTVLRHLQHGVRRDSEEEAGGVDDLGGLDHGPVDLLLDVGDGEAVGGVQLGHQGPVLVGDEDGAAAGGLVAHLVLHIDPRLPRPLLQDLAGVVTAHAAHVGGHVGLGQHPLRHADAVLGGAARDVVHLVLGQVLEDVLLLGQDRVVGLEVVFGQQLGLHRGGDVQQGVAHPQERVLTQQLAHLSLEKMQ